MSTYGSFLLLAITCIILSTSVFLYAFSQSTDCNQQTEFSTEETSQTIAPLPWDFTNDNRRKVLEVAWNLPVVGSKGLKGTVGKVFELTFDTEGGIQQSYVIRSPFAFRMKKCSDAYRRAKTWDEKKMEETLKEMKIKRPNQWYFFDLVAYHLDRLLQFHITPITTSYINTVEHMIQGINMDIEKYNYTTKSEIKAAVANCLYAKPALGPEGKAFGTMQIKLRPEGNLRLDTVSMFQGGKRQLQCIRKGDCPTSPASISKMYIMDFLLGTTDRKVNSWVYGRKERGKGRFYPEESRAILIDNDAQWDRRAWDLELEQVVWCQARVKHSNPPIYCLHPGIVSHFEPYKTRSITKDLRSSLRKEALYSVDETYREWVDETDLFYIEKGVERILYVFDRYNFPSDVVDEPILFDEYLS